MAGRPGTVAVTVVPKSRLLACYALIALAVGIAVPLACFPLGLS